MNKKGFATSTIIFSLLSVFLITISILLFTMSNTSSLNDSINNKVVQNIEYGENSSINDIQNQLKELQEKYDKLANSQVNNIYPVGSIYITTSDKSPNDLFPGTEWDEYSQGRVLVGYNGDSVAYNPIGKTGGSAKVTLTTKNLPSHTHTYSGTTKSTGSGYSITNADTKVNTTSSGSHNHLMYAYSANLYRKTGTIGNPNFLAAVSGTNADSVSTTSNKYTGDAGAHTHSVTYKKTTGISGVQAHTHTYSGTTAATGDGEAISALDPYVVVHIYKRTK